MGRNAHGRVLHLHTAAERPAPSSDSASHVDLTLNDRAGATPAPRADRVDRCLALLPLCRYAQWLICPGPEAFWLVQLLIKPLGPG